MDIVIKKMFGSGSISSSTLMTMFREVECVVIPENKVLKEGSYRLHNID